MTYVDGFVIPLPLDKYDEYVKIASAAGEVWMDHGALAYKECIGDDLSIEGPCGSFLNSFQPQDGETVLFSFIVYKSRAHRDEVNKKVMEDPRLKNMCGQENSPFDITRMAYGGFKAFVDL